MTYDFRELAGLTTTLLNVEFEGGGAVLAESQIQTLMAHPAYTDSRHPNHEQLSTTIRSWYQAHFPEDPSDSGDGTFLQSARS